MTLRRVTWLQRLRGDKSVRTTRRFLARLGVVVKGGLFVQEELEKHFEPRVSRQRLMEARWE